MKTRKRNLEIIPLGAETNKIEIEEEESIKHGVDLLSHLLDKNREPLLKYKEYPN